MKSKIEIKAENALNEAHRYPWAKASDYEDVPCPKRSRIIDRFLRKLGDLKDKTKFDIDRVSTKMDTIITMENPGWEKDLVEAANAQNMLMEAHRVYSAKVKKARLVSKWARRSCRRTGK